MIASAQADAGFIRKVAAYLCRNDARSRSAASPHLIDPRYRAIRQASQRRELLRNLKAAPQPA